MTSLAHLYSDFGTPPAAAVLPPPEEEPAAPPGFETGYAAGWQDAIREHESEAHRLSTELVQQVQDMSFTYHEAYSKLSLGMRPLIIRLVTKLLPEVIQHGLAAHLAEQIGALMDAQAENAIEIAVAPERLSSLQALLAEQVSVPFSFVPEYGLGSGQAFLRVNQTEREIDLESVAQSITTAVEAFYHSHRQDSQDD